MGRRRFFAGEPKTGSRQVYISAGATIRFCKNGFACGPLQNMQDEIIRCAMVSTITVSCKSA